MRRLACIALLALSGCAPSALPHADIATTDGHEWPHLVSSGLVSNDTFREQFDDGTVCYRPMIHELGSNRPVVPDRPISCVVLPK